MKKLAVLLTVVVFTCTPAFAGKANKNANAEAKQTERPGKVIKQFDKNGNHQIDGTEVDALKADFAAHPKGPLARLDRNSDGKLEDDEIKALNAHLEKRADAKANKKKKNA